jgi:hypothetical protein
MRSNFPWIGLVISLTGSAALSFLLAIALRHGSFHAIDYLDLGAAFFNAFLFVSIYVASYFYILGPFRASWPLLLSPSLDSIAVMMKIASISVLSFYMLLFTLNRLEGIPRSVPFIHFLCLITLQTYATTTLQFLFRVSANDRHNLSNSSGLGIKEAIVKYFTQSVAHKQFLSDLLSLLIVIFGWSVSIVLFDTYLLFAVSVILAIVLLDSILKYYRLRRGWYGCNSLESAEFIRRLKGDPSTGIGSGPTPALPGDDALRSTDEAIRVARQRKSSA